jgi:hypothetical protein
VWLEQSEPEEKPRRNWKNEQHCESEYVIWGDITFIHSTRNLKLFLCSKPLVQLWNQKGEREAGLSWSKHSK